MNTCNKCLFNIRYLKDRLDALNVGTLPLEEHDLIEVDKNSP